MQNCKASQKYWTPGSADESYKFNCLSIHLYALHLSSLSIHLPACKTICSGVAHYFPRRIYLTENSNVALRKNSSQNGVNGNFLKISIFELSVNLFVKFYLKLFLMAGNKSDLKGLLRFLKKILCMPRMGEMGLFWAQN